MASFPLSFLKFKDKTIFVAFGDSIYRYNYENEPSISSVCISDIATPITQENDDQSSAVPNGTSANAKKIPEKAQILAFYNWRSQNKLIVCDTRKNLLVFDARDLKLQKNVLLSKPATAVIASEKNKVILVADRAGNVVRFDLDQEKGSTILGHVSVIFDLILSHDEKFLLTCDRDEKIRVSRFPNVYNIESFCLDHKRYIFSLAWLEMEPECRLISGSGDGTIILWEYLTGDCRFTFQCRDFVQRDCEIRKILPLKLTKSRRALIVLFHKHSTVLNLTFDFNDKVDNISHFVQNLDDFPLDITLDDQDENSYIGFFAEKPMIRRFVVRESEDFSIEQVSDARFDIINDNKTLIADIEKARTLKSALFLHDRIDNLSVYENQEEKRKKLVT